MITLKSGKTHNGRRVRPLNAAPIPDCLHLGQYVGADQSGCCGAVSIYQCAVHGVCTKERCKSCPERDSIPFVELLTELPDGDPVGITVGIPVRGQVDLLEWVIKLHRRQRGVIPQFILADTGSSAEELATMREWAKSSPDIELVELGVIQAPHASEPVCVAMQAIYDRCQTRYLLQTHSDCLPASHYAMWDVVSRLKDYAAVGYRMSERKPHPVWDWRRMLSHTFTGFDRQAIGPLSHSMRPACEAVGQLAAYESGNPGWPDTEVGFNAGLTGKPVQFLGPEQNCCLDKTPHYWHVRSLPSSALYAAGYHAKALEWKKEAIQQAERWLAEWSI